MGIYGEGGWMTGEVSGENAILHGCRDVTVNVRGSDGWESVVGWMRVGVRGGGGGGGVAVMVVVVVRMGIRRER